VNSLPKTVTRQCRDCDLNPGPSAPESSTLTTRLPSHPRCESPLSRHHRSSTVAADRRRAQLASSSTARRPENRFSLPTLAVILQHCRPFNRSFRKTQNFWAPLYFLALFWILLGLKDVMSRPEPLTGLLLSVHGMRLVSYSLFVRLH